MGHLDVSGVSYALADGRPLLDDVSFRVPGGSVTALIGPNGVGKSTLLGIVTGQLAPDEGTVAIGGTLAVMSQFVGVRGNVAGATSEPSRGRSDTQDGTVRDLLLAVSPAPIRGGGRRGRRGRTDLDDRRVRCRRDASTRTPWPTGPTSTATSRRPPSTWPPSRRWACPTTGRSSGRSPACPAGSRSGWCWSCCWPGRRRCCCWTSRTTTSTCPAKIWLEGRLAATDKAVLLVSPRPGAAGQCRQPDRHPGAGRRRRGVLGARRVVRRLRPGHGRTATPGSRSCAGGGTRSTTSSRPWC